MLFPEQISTISLKCKSILYTVNIFELGDTISIRTNGGSCHVKVCDFQISPGSTDYLGIGINLGDYSGLSDDEKSSLRTWIPRRGVFSVIDFLCGKFTPTLKNIIILPNNEDITTDPQKQNMVFFRERCRYDVLRVIKETVSNPKSPDRISPEYIQSSNLLSRIYEKVDIQLCMDYWSTKDILQHGTLDGSYSINLHRDREILSLVDDYDWEEDTLGNNLNNNPNKDEKAYDVFICHSSEDKESLVRPLAKTLTEKGLRVWYDEFTLKIGDRLRSEIDTGLRSSRFGIVVLSKSFFQKEWTQYELDGLVDKEVNGQKVILPVWHDVDHDDVAEYSHSLATRVAANSSKGIEKIVADLLEVIRPNEASETSP